MPKDKPTNMTPSWRFFPVSARLAWRQAYSLAWLVFIPAVLGLIAFTQYNVTKAQLGTDSSFEQVFQSLPMAIAGLLIVAAFWRILAYPATVVLAYGAVRGAKDRPLNYLAVSRPYFWRLWGLQIVVSVVILLGLIALIVPGFVFLRRYMMSPYYLVANDCGIFEAMRLSSKASKPCSGGVWGTFGVLCVIGIVANFAADIPSAGLLLGPLVGLLYFFGLSLRQHEIGDSPIKLSSLPTVEE